MKKKQPQSLMLKFFDYIGSVFLKGALTLLPIVLTLALLNFLFKLIKSWLHPIYVFEPKIFQAIPHSEIILAITVIFLVGLVFRTLLLDKLLDALESLFSKIPLLRPIYFGIKQIVRAFTIKDKVTFQKIVYIEFPKPGLYSIGFVTNVLKKEIAPDQHATYYSLFIPTTPNPTTGYFVAVKPEECTEVNLTKQEAMSLIISGGILQPESKKDK